MSELEQLKKENAELKEKVEYYAHRVNRLEDIKWNYEAVLDQLSSDEVCEAKHNLGLDYEDFDPNCDVDYDNEEENDENN